MSNNQNLKSISDRTMDEQREITKKGGIASGISRRKKKIFDELIAEILDRPVAPEMADTIQKSFALKSEYLTIKEAMVYAQALKAVIEGNTAAFNALADRVDGKPIQENKISEAEYKPTTLILTRKEFKERAEELRGTATKVIIDDIPR